MDHPFMPRPFSKSARLRFAVLLVLAAHPGAATTARAQDTLRVGRAIANSWSFVPLDVGMAAGIFARHGLAIESVSFTGSARLQQGMAAKSIDIGLSSGPELAMVAKGAPVIAVGAIVLSPRMTITVRANGRLYTEEFLIRRSFCRRVDSAFSRVVDSASPLSWPGLSRPSRQGTHRHADLSEMAGNIRAFTPVFDVLCPAMTS
jgi:hypothetical protein